MSKSEIINWFAGSSASLSGAKIITVLCITLILAAVIFLTYRFTYSGVAYDPAFNAGNVILALIAAVVMLMIGSNIAISLGMVGALSIVRFRTAIKNPRDTIYIFWSLVTGLCSGAGVYQLAVMQCLFIAAVLVAMSFYTGFTSHYIIIVRGSREIDRAGLEELLNSNFKRVSLRAANNRQEKTELIYEIKTKGTLKAEFTASLREIVGVESANWILETDDTIG